MLGYKVFGIFGYRRFLIGKQAVLVGKRHRPISKKSNQYFRRSQRDIILPEAERLKPLSFGEERC